jgi:hypothetical protein
VLNKLTRFPNFPSTSILKSIILLLMAVGCTALPEPAFVPSVPPAAQTVDSTVPSEPVLAVQPQYLQKEPTISQPILILPSSTPAAIRPTVTNPAFTPTPSPSPTLTPMLLQPEDWMLWPVLPEVSTTARETYQRGLEMGTDPHSFSVIGDCQSEQRSFLGAYDVGQYKLNENEQYLQQTIDQFSGSFNRWDMTTIDGGNIAIILVEGWYGAGICFLEETPLECELRLHNPSIMFIHMGTHWSSRNSQYLRMTIDLLIERGVLPILVTKADNLEGNHAVNLDIAYAAYEYNLPMWNFWASVQDLVSHGLTFDYQGRLAYLTIEARDLHRHTALQVLDKVWRAVIQ